MKKFDCDLFCKRVNKLFADAKQEEISEKLHLSQGAVSAIRNHKSKVPASDTIFKIANEYNVSADWILGLSDNLTTDKATKELCDTLGLSDTAIELLKDNSNQEIRDVINFLIGQHYDVECCCNDDGFAPPSEYISVLSELVKFFKICNFENEYKIEIDDYNIDGSPEFRLTTSNASGEKNTVYKEEVSGIYDICLNLNVSEIMADECMEKIANVLNDIFQNCRAENIVKPHGMLTNTIPSDLVRHKSKTFDYYVNIIPNKTED